MARHSVRGLALSLGFGLAFGLLAAAPAWASEPRLDELAAARGIGEGELGHGRRDVVPAGSQLRQASAERRTLTLHGLPIRGAFETLWQIDDAPARVVAARYPARDAALRPEQAGLDVDAARERLTVLRPSASDVGFGSRGAPEAELVYLLLAETPVLAWELTLPFTMRPQPSRERVWISAADGRELGSVELVDADRLADVYEFNPVHTPSPITVTLGDLDPEPAPWAEGMVVEPGYLTGKRVRVFNCIDEEDGPFAPWHKDGECFATQRTRADANGDYLVPVPDVSILSENKDPTDLYAELSMYYHAEKFFAVLVGLGVEEFPCELANMVANFHWIDPAPLYPDLEFGPLNNAYYSGSCEIEKGPTMLFGQGSEIDFAFDGDVIYHELGHGIVAQLTPEGLRGYAQRSDGVLADARGLNEAIADYHTLMISERPEMGDYAGFYWADLGRAWIRYADNDAQCPRDMAGQPHNDSAPVTAALWAARRRVGGQKLDPVVLASLPLLPVDATLENMAAALLQVADAERDAGMWSDWDYEQLERALATRGVIECERVIDDPINLEEPKFMYLRNNGNYVSPFWPGPVQFRQRIPAGSDNLLLSFEISSEGNSSGQPVRHDLYPSLLVKRSSVSADAPMTFTYDTAVLGHHDPEDGNTTTTWEVGGDWDEIYSSTVLGESRRQILIRGLEPGEVVHLSFANNDREVAVVRELVFASVPSEELDDGSPVDGREPDAPAIEDAGCACATGPDHDKRHASGLGVLLLLALGRRRSRPR